MNPFGLPKWGFLVSSNDNLFRTFADRMHGPDFALWPCEAGYVCTEYVLSSVHFHWAANVSELADRGAALKAIFDGAMYVSFGAVYFPPRLRMVVNNLDNSRHSFEPGSVQAEPYSEIALALSIPAIHNPLRYFGPDQMMFLARYDIVARDLLRQLGFNGPNYVTLFAMFDWLKSNGYDSNMMAAAAGVAHGEIKRFTATVNNVQALGPMARHGDKKQQPPSNPMTLAEAQMIILPAVADFLRRRAVEFDLQAKWDAIKSDERIPTSY